MYTGEVYACSLELEFQHVQGENCFHIALLLNTPSTLAIAKYLVKWYGKTLVGSLALFRSTARRLTR